MEINFWWLLPALFTAVVLANVLGDRTMFFGRRSARYMQLVLWGFLTLFFVLMSLGLVTFG